MSDSIIPTIPEAPKGPNMGRWAYAGFGRRTFAMIIDLIILFLAAALALLPFSIVVGLAQFLLLPLLPMSGVVSLSYYMLMAVVAWLYFALMESSDWGATLGKRIMRLRVMDSEGNPLGFMRASLRYFAKYISCFIFMLGFLMAAFTPKKQTLHDLIADALVMKRK
ncbi:MAG: RDD family protein [Alphaproteobacteria bacterium]|nr:RDD family protein [Alphaproteobacteria bacterium]